jgi:hypothetical protein
MRLSEFRDAVAAPSAALAAALAVAAGQIPHHPPGQPQPQQLQLQQQAQRGGPAPGSVVGGYGCMLLELDAAVGWEVRQRGDRQC